MGRKVHPYGFRLGVSRTWTAKWYADKEYTALLKEDIGIRQLVDRRPCFFGRSDPLQRVEIVP